MNNSEDARNLFVEIVYKMIFESVYKDMEENLLPKGMPLRSNDPAALADWYSSLDKSSQEHIKEIVKLTIQESILGMLTHLDNRGGTVLPGKLADFAIYLQVYENIESLKNNQPEEATRINKLFSTGDSLEYSFITRLRNE